MKLKDIFNMKRLRGTGIGAAVGTVAAVAALVFIPGAALLLPVVPTLIVGAGAGTAVGFKCSGPK